MAKFIIEISEDFIRKHSDVKALAESVMGKSGLEAIGDLLYAMSFSGILKAIEEGKTEFHVSGDFSDENLSQAYESAAKSVAIIAYLSEKGSDKAKTDEV